MENTQILGLLDADPIRRKAIDGICAATGGILVQEPRRLMALVKREPSELVVLGPVDAQGGPTSLLVGRLRREHPHIAVVVVCDASPVSVRELLYLARAGVDEVVLTSMATPSEMLLAVERARSRRRGSTLWSELASAVPPEFHEVFQFCLSGGRKAIGVQSIADLLGIDRSTLASRLARADLPPAHTILSWSRLLIVIDLAASAGIPIERSARVGGFRCATALRVLAKRLLGLPPKTILARGGPKLVLDAFRALLTERLERPSRSVPERNVVTSLTAVPRESLDH